MSWASGGRNVRPLAARDVRVNGYPFDVIGVRALGLERRTLVAFTADHGEEFFEHGRAFHGQSVYGELNNMPLILWRPGAVRAGVVVEPTVQMIDVMPPCST